MANIFSPTSNYTYGGFTSQPATNIFNGVNPYYINNNNSYSPTPLVMPQPVQPAAPVINNYSGGDNDNAPPPQYSQFTGFGFGNNTGYNGPYNQGNPLADLQPSYSFGNFNVDINPGTVLGGIASYATGIPFLSMVGTDMYNNWDKMSFANPVAADQKKTFSKETVASYKPTLLGVENGVSNYGSDDPGAVNADGSVNWNNLGNPDYVTIDGIGVSNPNTGSSSSSSGGSSGGGNNFGYGGDGSGYGESGSGFGGFDDGTDASDAAAAAQGEW